MFSEKVNQNHFKELVFAFYRRRIIRAKLNDLSGAHGYGPVPPGPNASHIHINGERGPVPSGYKPPPNTNVIQ